MKTCISDFKMINYQDILNKNLLKVFKEILKEIEKNGLNGKNHLYVTFKTKNRNTLIPKWLLEKYPTEMTIVIQNEYYHLAVNKNDFNIGLSFNNLKTNLKISYDSVISFADPSSNFGLNYQFNDIINNKNKKLETNIKKNSNKKKQGKKLSNVVNFTNYKKKLI